MPRKDSYTHSRHGGGKSVAVYRLCSVWADLTDRASRLKEDTPEVKDRLIYPPSLIPMACFYFCYLDPQLDVHKSITFCFVCSLVKICYLSNVLARILDLNGGISKNLEISTRQSTS